MLKRLFILCIGTVFLAACETASTTSVDSAGDASSSASASSTSSGTASSSSSSSTAAATEAEKRSHQKEMLKKEFAKVGSTILFDYDSSALSDYAQRTLDRQAAFLKAPTDSAC